MNLGFLESPTDVKLSQGPCGEAVAGLTNGKSDKNPAFECGLQSCIVSSRLVILRRGAAGDPTGVVADGFFFNLLEGGGTLSAYESVPESSTTKSERRLFFFLAADLSFASSAGQ